jgi:protein-tyrosine phosphatase
MASDAAYIQSALDAIEQQHGSIDAFVETQLGETPTMKRRIVANLTRPG